jgi:hypothetical protein
VASCLRPKWAGEQSSHRMYVCASSGLVSPPGRGVCAASWLVAYRPSRDIKKTPKQFPNGPAVKGKEERGGLLECRNS